MAESSKQYLVHAEEGTQFGPLSGTRGDVEFPSMVRGWSDVLDCRHKPYTGKTLAELRHFAHHVNKRFILVHEASLGSRDALLATAAQDDASSAGEQG